MLTEKVAEKGKKEVEVKVAEGGKDNEGGGYNRIKLDGGEES